MGKFELWQGDGMLYVITGASRGLGREYVRFLDKRISEGAEFFLVARSLDDLKNLSGELVHRVHLYSGDLGDPAVCLDMQNKIMSLDMPVKFAVLNAGIGKQGIFTDLTSDNILATADLNVTGTSYLAHLLLSTMANGTGMLFTASVAAFLPQPGFACYAATKAYIYSLSLALSEEMKARDIYVGATFPNVMLTGFHDAQSRQKLEQSVKRFGLENPEKVATKTLIKASRGKRVIITSKVSKLIFMAAHVLPKRLFLAFMRKNLT